MRTPNTTESYLRHPTSTLLATPGSVRVLRELLEADAPLAVSTLAERTRLSGQGVRNTLAELRRGGIVEELGEGRGRLYRPDLSHPLYLPLASLFQAETERFQTIVEGLAAAVGNLTPAPLGAWIYGTVVRAEDLPESDLEVALVAVDEDVKTPVTRLREMLGPMQDVQRVWVSVVGLAPSDVRRLSSKGDRWWKNATDPHVPLFGKGPLELADELERPPLPQGVFRL